MAKKKHGGKRKGAGRKKLPKLKKKVTIQIYEPGEIVEAVGGMDAAKDLASRALNEAAGVL